MTEIEKTISVLGDKRRDAVRYKSQGGKPNWSSGGIGEYYMADIYTAAIAALRAQAERENPKPLTVEQLREMDGEPLKHWAWIEIIEPVVFYHSKVKSGYFRTQADFTCGEAFCCGWPGTGYAFDYEDYKKTWIAYASRPSAEDAKDTNVPTNFNRITASKEALAEFLNKCFNEARDDWESPGCYGCDNYGTHHADKALIGTEHEHLYGCGSCKWENGILEWLGRTAEMGGEANA